MAAGATYEPIATTTLSSNQTNVTFSSISGSYTDLILVANAKAVSSGSNQWWFLTFNNDTSSNFSSTFLRGNGTTASSGRYSNRSDGIFPGDTDNADLSTMIIHIMNYSNTTTYKTTLSRSSDASDYVTAVVGLWRSTSAITSLKITNQDIPNNIASGSTFTLYGIASA